MSYLSIGIPAVVILVGTYYTLRLSRKEGNEKRLFTWIFAVAAATCILLAQVYQMQTYDSLLEDLERHPSDTYIVLA